MVVNNEYFINNYINSCFFFFFNINNMYWSKLDIRYYIKLGVFVLKELKIYIKVESVKNIYMR